MNFFRGKKITLMGLGLLGRGIGDVRFLARQGAQLVVTDLKTEEALAPALEALQDCEHITYRLGEHRLEDFRNRDLIIRAANVPLDSPYLTEAQKNGIRVTQSVTLFAELFDGTLIGVTGTKGKTTVTQLVYHILKYALLPQRARNSASSYMGIYMGHVATHLERTPAIWLGGNTQGVSTLALLDQAQSGDIAVLELDSWQLNSFGDAHISPQVAVFTNLLPDHMNYYHGDMDSYFEDKANIFKYQKDDAVLIAGREVTERILERYPEVATRIQVPDNNTVPQTWKYQLRGAHNKENIAFAVLTARALGIEEQYIKEAVETFTGVPGRLELLREKSGVQYYNDTTATMPDAVIAALTSFDTSTRVILIMGGADKQSPDNDLKRLAQAVQARCKAVVLLRGTGTERIKPLLDSTARDEYDALAPAVAQAAALAQPGDVVLLSPGFASFGMFHNEYDRGEQFARLVHELS